MKNGVYTVRFHGRECEDCQVTFRQGYISKVVHPEEGQWDIGSESSAWIGTEYISIDPKESSSFKAIDEMIKKSKAAPPPKPVTTVVQTPDPIAETTDAIEYFPALNLFLIVLTIAVVMFIGSLVVKAIKTSPTGQ